MDASHLVGEVLEKPGNPNQMSVRRPRIDVLPFASVEIGRGGRGLAMDRMPGNLNNATQPEAHTFPIFSVGWCPLAVPTRVMCLPVRLLRGNNDTNGSPLGTKEQTPQTSRQLVGRKTVAATRVGNCGAGCPISAPELLGLELEPRPAHPSDHPPTFSEGPGVRVVSFLVLI